MKCLRKYTFECRFHCRILISDDGNWVNPRTRTLIKFLENPFEGFDIFLRKKSYNEDNRRLIMI